MRLWVIWWDKRGRIVIEGRGWTSMDVGMWLFQVCHSNSLQPTKPFLGFMEKASPYLLTCHLVIGLGGFVGQTWHTFLLGKTILSFHVYLGRLLEWTQPSQIKYTTPIIFKLILYNNIYVCQFFNQMIIVFLECKVIHYFID